TSPHFEKKGRDIFKDPWAAREAYVRVLLDRSTENVEKFLAAHAFRDLSGAEKTKALKLLEMQRHALLMYTSCGWFFDELSGIETVQVLQYAGRVIQLAGEVLDLDLEEEFLKRLEKAPSNLPVYGNGRNVYEKCVRPARVDLSKVAAHYAIRSAFENDP